MFIKIILVTFLIIEVIQLFDRKFMLNINALTKAASLTGQKLTDLMPRDALIKYLIYFTMSLYYLIALIALLFTHIRILPLSILLIFFLKNLFFKDRNWYYYVVDLPVSVGLILYGLIFL